MAQAKTSPAQFLSEESPENIAANKRYLDAEKALTEALTNRKMMFDPTLLALAEGFGAPTRSGSFGESLGYAAAKVGSAQEREAKLRQEMLERQLAVAGQGIELQRQRTRDKDISQFLLGDQPPPTAGPIAGPKAGAVTGPQAGPLSAPSAEGVVVTPLGPLSQAAPQAEGPKVVEAPQGSLAVRESEKPPGFEGVQGMPVMSPNPAFMTQKQYVAANRGSKKSLGELMAEGAKLENDRYKSTEKGIVDLKTGMRYAYDDGTFVSMPIMGPGFDNKNFTIPTSVAMRLTNMANANDFDGYTKLAKQFTGGFGSDNSGTKTPSDAERQVEKIEAETRAKTLSELSAKKEASLEETTTTARRVFGNVTRVADYINQSPNYFGIFARPGVIAAIGNLITEGIKTPSGSLNIAGFENSMRQMMPGVTQKDLDNVTKAATELAELELAFTRLYLAQQGAVTEGERKIVRAVPGTTSTSPEVLRTRMDLLKSRSQYDIDISDAFRQWQDKNPGRSYLEFERKSDLYKDIKKGFEEETERIFGGIKAVPTNQRQPKPTAPAAGGNAPSSGYIKDSKTGVNRRKLPGE